MTAAAATTGIVNPQTNLFLADALRTWKLHIYSDSTVVPPPPPPPPALAALTHLHLLHHIKGSLDLFDGFVTQKKSINYLGTVVGTAIAGDILTYPAVGMIEIWCDPFSASPMQGVLTFTITVDNELYTFQSDNLSFNPQMELYFQGSPGSIIHPCCTDVSEVSWSATAQG